MIGVIALPVIDAWINITNKKMKGISDTTVTCFANPSLLVVMIIIIASKG
jgi:hypothetical protein